MDSFAVSYDKTLPIDLDGSTNPDLLTEVTYGEHGFAPMMEKSSTGRMSPVRGRTMKEYDQQIADLKKENFNLKLRIYFMEERMNTKYKEEDVIKTNIELKVETESYKKDLHDKQALLEKASETIDTLTSKYSEELEKNVIKIKEDAHDQFLQANQHIAALEQELTELQEKDADYERELEDKHDTIDKQDKQIQNLVNQLQEKESALSDVTAKLQETERALKELTFDAKEQEDQLQEELDNLKTFVGRKDRDIQRLSVIVKDQTNIEGISVLEKSRLQDTIEDKTQNYARLQAKYADKERECKKGQDMVGKLEDLLREKEKEKAEYRKALKERNEQYQSAKEMVRELVKKHQLKSEEAEELQVDLENVQDQLRKAKEQLYLANEEKRKEADRVAPLQENLERLARTLGKKEGELEGFKELLQKAQMSLSMSEDAVESLEKQLEKERCRCQLKKPKEASEDNDALMKLRRELDDLHAQLAERDQMYDRKCNQLDTVAHQLNITLDTQSGDSHLGMPSSDKLQQILDELKMLKGAVETDRHVHIDINSSHQSIHDNQHNTDDADGNKPPRHPHNGYSSTDTHGNHGSHPISSRIPVRRGSSTSSNPEDSNLRKQITDMSARNQALKNTLTATEETVHCQTQKMKLYKNMLIENGIMPMSRSNSDPNLAKSALLSPRMNTREAGRSRFKSTENISNRGRSMSPSALTSRSTGDNSNPLADDFGKLLKDNSKLKEQVDGYRKVLKAFQDRSPSPGSDSTGESGKDGEPAPPRPISSESAGNLLDNWLDMLDKFLQELSYADQTNLSPTGTSIGEATKLRRGLVEARGAIQSLSGTSIDGQDGSVHGGRLSPDSGCSDHNPASVHNNSLKSPLTSPTHNNLPKSPLTSPRGNGNYSSTGLSQNGQYNTTSPNRLDQSINSRSINSCVDSNLKLSPTSPRDNGNHSSFSSQGMGKYSPTSPSENGKYLQTSKKRSPGSQPDCGADPRLLVNNDGSLRRLGSQFSEVSQVSSPDNDTETGSYPILSQIDITQSSDRLFPSRSSNQSIERMRKETEFLDQGDISMSSMNSSVFGGNKVLADENRFSIPNRPNFNPVNPQLERLKGFPQSSLKSPLPKQNGGLGVRFSNPMDQTFSRSFMADMTLGNLDTTNMMEDYSIYFDDMNVPNTREMHQQIRDLEAKISSYEDEIQNSNRPDMESLKQYLLELQQLRTQLEKSIKLNEIQEAMLMELKSKSDEQLRYMQEQLESLRSQLAQCQDNIREKVKIISEKDKTLKETNISLVKFRDNSASASAESDMYRERVKSLELEMNDLKSTRDKLTSTCQQLKTALERYRNRCEQLEGDNKQHVEAVTRYRQSAEDIQIEFTERLKAAEKATMDTSQYQNRITELEGDTEQFKENEKKYQNMLIQSRSQVNKLTADIEMLRDEYKKLTNELETSLQIMENVNHQSLNKDEQLCTLKKDLDTKNELIQQQDATCQGMHKKLESMNSVNNTLSTQLEQQRITCSDYKRQIDKQNQLTRDLKERSDCLSRELMQSLNNRESIEKVLAEKQNELQLTTKQRDKYLYNLKYTLKEFCRYKKELKELRTKCETTDALNHTLKLELSVSEKLIEEKTDMFTDDDKHHMIAQLLKELGLARKQMVTILDQNASIRQQIAEIIEQKNKENMEPTKSGKSTSASQLLLEDNTDLPTRFDANDTWPMNRDLFSGLTRTDNLSTSLPLRAGTQAHMEAVSANQKEPSKSLSASFSDSQSDYPKSASDSASFSSNQSDVLKLSGSHFSIPGPVYKQRVTDECLYYHTDDSPKKLAAMTQVRIDSDLRSLFAVGMIDTFEKLQKETKESDSLLRGLATRVTERLKHYEKVSATESMEYGTLKEISYAADHLRLCVDSQMSAIACFWVSELPAPDEKGEFVNKKLQDENTTLEVTLSALQARYDQMRIHSPTPTRTVLREEQICRSLESTLDVVTRAKQNFQHKHEMERNSPKRAGRSPHK